MEIKKLIRQLSGDDAPFLVQRHEIFRDEPRELEATIEEAK